MTVFIMEIFIPGKTVLIFRWGLALFAKRSHSKQLSNSCKISSYFSVKYLFLFSCSHDIGVWSTLLIIATMATDEDLLLNFSLGNGTLNGSSDYAENGAGTVLFQYYVWGITGNIIAILGIIGNVLSIVVLTNQRMISSTSCYLIALAIFDTIVLMASVLFLCLPTFYTAKQTLEDYYYAYPYMHPYAYPVSLIAQTCSIYTTVAFTVERYIAVCRPLKAAKLCTISNARRAIIILVCCSVVYNIPRMLEYKVEMTFENSTNKSFPRIQTTDLGSNPTFRHVYFVFMHMAFMLIIPSTMLAVLNTCLIRAVKQSEKTRGKVNTKTRRENSLTIMLISVVIVFLVCQVPSIVDNILYATLDAQTYRKPLLVKLYCISNLMVMINSATNFYIYCLFGNKFRRVCCRIFCVCYLRATKSLLSNDSSVYNPSMRNPTRTSTVRMATLHTRRNKEPQWNKLHLSIYENGKTRSYCTTPELNGKYAPMDDDQTHLWIIKNVIFMGLCKRHKSIVNGLGPRQNGCFLPDDICKCIFLYENVVLNFTKICSWGWQNWQ